MSVDSPITTVLRYRRKGNKDTVAVKDGKVCVDNKPLAGLEKTFVFDCTATQKDVFERIARDRIRSGKGENLAFIAYGQSSSGKTYSILGPPEDLKWNAENEGLYPRCIRDLHDFYQDVPSKYEIRVLEVYLKKSLRDLISGQQLKFRGNDTFYVDDKDAKTKVAPVDLTKADWTLDVDAALEVIRDAQSRRVMGSTALSDVSSRSHMIIVLRVTARGAKLNPRLITLVDLAGSEHAGVTQGMAAMKKEGIAINTSLLELGMIVKKLGEGSDFIGFKNNLLTWLLQPSLSDGCRTIVFGTFRGDHVTQTKATVLFVTGVTHIKVLPAAAPAAERDEPLAKIDNSEFSMLVDTNAALKEQIRKLKESNEKIALEYQQITQEKAQLEEQLADAQKTIESCTVFEAYVDSCYPIMRQIFQEICELVVSDEGMRQDTMFLEENERASISADFSKGKYELQLKRLDESLGREKDVLFNKYTKKIEGEFETLQSQIRMEEESKKFQLRRKMDTLDVARKTIKEAREYFQKCENEEQALPSDETYKCTLANLSNWMATLQSNQEQLAKFAPDNRILSDIVSLTNQATQLHSRIERERFAAPLNYAEQRLNSANAFLAMLSPCLRGQPFANAAPHLGILSPRLRAPQPQLDASQLLNLMRAYDAARTKRFDLEPQLGKSKRLENAEALAAELEQLKNVVSESLLSLLEYTLRCCAEDVEGATARLASIAATPTAPLEKIKDVAAKLEQTAALLSNEKVVLALCEVQFHSRALEGKVHAAQLENCCSGASDAKEFASIRRLLDPLWDKLSDTEKRLNATVSACLSMRDDTVVGAVIGVEKSRLLDVRNLLRETEIIAGRNTLLAAQKPGVAQAAFIDAIAKAMNEADQYKAAAWEAFRQWDLVFKMQAQFDDLHKSFSNALAACKQKPSISERHAALKDASRKFPNQYDSLKSEVKKLHDARKPTPNPGEPAKVYSLMQSHAAAMQQNLDGIIRGADHDMEELRNALTIEEVKNCCWNYRLPISLSSGILLVAVLAVAIVVPIIVTQRGHDHGALRVTNTTVPPPTTTTPYPTTIWPTTSTLPPTITTTSMTTSSTPVTLTTVTPTTAATTPSTAATTPTTAASTTAAPTAATTAASTTAATTAASTTVAMTPTTAASTTAAPTTAATTAASTTAATTPTTVATTPTTVATTAASTTVAMTPTTAASTTAAPTTAATTAASTTAATTAASTTAAPTTPTTVATTPTTVATTPTTAATTPTTAASTTAAPTTAAPTTGTVKGDSSIIRSKGLEIILMVAVGVLSAGYAAVFGIWLYRRLQSKDPLHAPV